VLPATSGFLQKEVFHGSMVRTKRQVHHFGVGWYKGIARGHVRHYIVIYEESGENLGLEGLKFLFTRYAHDGST